MSKQLPNIEFERLAQLVGEVLAKRWLQILSKRRATTAQACQPQANRQRKPNKGEG
jgi:hypothetical protein